MSRHGSICRAGAQCSDCRRRRPLQGKHWTSSRACVWSGPQRVRWVPKGRFGRLIQVHCGATLHILQSTKRYRFGEFVATIEHLVQSQNQHIHRLSAGISIAKAMAGLNSPERSTTHASNESAVSFGGLAARSCPAQASLDESVTMVGCEVHSLEPLLTPAAFRFPLLPLDQSRGDRSPCVSLGNASRAGSQGSARSKKTEGPPRTSSQK